MNISQEIIDKLVAKAQEALNFAYAPYSNYRVGAAVLWDSGRITSGSNVENASYGLTVCAERSAISAGTGLGERMITALAVAVPYAEIPVPCGSCRQVIREFARNCEIILVNGKGKVRKTTLEELFPDSFGPEFLRVREGNNSELK